MTFFLQSMLCLLDAHQIHVDYFCFIPFLGGRPDETTSELLERTPHP